MKLRKQEQEMRNHTNGESAGAGSNMEWLLSTLPTLLVSNWIHFDQI